MKCCVYSRFVFEYPYLNSFIEHYLNLGFDKIIILYTDIIEYPLADNLKEYVSIHQVENLGNKSPEAYKDFIPEDIDWVLHVDSDEFLLLHQKYDCIQSFIQSKLEINENINIFAFMWSWLHKFDYHENDNISITDIVGKYKKMIGNRITNNKYKNKQEVWIKSMFKLSDLRYLYIHCPFLKKPYVISLNNKIIDLDTTDKIKSFVIDDKEEYRFYEDSILVHIATRDLHNTIFKSLNIHKTQLKKKKINNEEQFKLELCYGNEKDDFELLNYFIEHIGYKVEWPITCLNKMKNINANVKIDMYLRSATMTFSHNREAYYKMHNNLLLNEDIINAMNKVINKFNIIFID